MTLASGKVMPGDAPPLRRASFAQERMWFLESLDPGSAIYNQLNAFRIRGPIDVRLLESSLSAVMARHGALRTNLFVADGQIFQRVMPPAPPGFQLIDLTQVGSPDDARRLLVEAARKPFDLAAEPLVRPYLLKLAQDDFILGLITHHTIIDGWSTRILIRELASFYNDLEHGHTPGSSLPAPAIQYADYAARQRARSDAGDYDRQLEHWMKVLEGDLPVLALPVDHQRSATQSYEGRAFTLILPPELTMALKAIGRKERATLFMTLLAAYIVLLYRYTGQDDIVVGCPVAGRNELDTEAMIGLFVNTLPMRCRISPSDSFLSLLRQVRAVALTAFDNQDLPFEKLVEKLAVPRSMDRSPVFQTLFQLRNFPGRMATLAGYPVERVEFDEVVAKADMTLEITETDEGLMCRFEYPVALFNPETIARMAGCWHKLLEDIIADPSKEVSRLRILTDEEQRHLLDMGRGLPGGYPRDATVDEIFTARAMAYPDNIAIVAGPERITYRELDARSSRLARKLRAMGVAAGTPVALLMERSVALVTAMLAVLKAGGAYVPLDTGDADGRIATIMADADVKIILAGPGLTERAKAWVPNVFGLEEAFGDDGPTDVAASESGNDPESLAYIIFTSGSTGVPKGVCIPHRGILRLVLDTDYVSIRACDVMAHLSSPAFDAATFEIWGALLNGATLVIIDRDTALSPAKLEAKIGECHIDVAFLPTPLFNAIATERPGCFRHIRDLLTGGDVMDPRQAKAVLDHGPPGRLLNVYGPTENTTFSTWYHISEVPAPDAPVPIGRPIASDCLYILDAGHQPVPLGVVGEICLASDGLATGYLRRLDLTAANFVPDPFRAGAMMYMTGDLGRFLPDGNVEFIGRRDGQVKIHGYRVETGEVARALESHPAVRTAIITVFSDPGGFKALAAYMVMENGATASTGDVRRYLAGKLPAYMVPASMTWIEAVPLTTRGKINRRALPDPALGMAQDTTPGASCADPSPTLSQMVAVWNEVLGISHVGPDDNFFDLGGHSLLAIRLMDRIEASFGVRMPVGAIFSSPSARQMLTSLREEGKSPAGNVLVPLQPEGNRPLLYCIHGVPGTLFEYDSLVRQIGKDQPVYGLQSPGLDGVTPVPDTVEAMASLYVDTVRRFQPRGPYHFLSYCAGGPFAYEMARQFMIAGEKVGFLGFIDYPAPKQNTRNTFWSCYCYVCDNAGGAVAHLSHFRHAGQQGQMRSLLALPGFLVRKMLKLPAEVAVRPVNSSGTDAAPAAISTPYPEWIISMSEPQRTIAMKNYDAIGKYYPTACNGTVTIFMSSERVRLSKRSGCYERTFGWKHLARGGVIRHIIKGDHGSIIGMENYDYIARITRKGIDLCQRADDGNRQ